MTIWKGFLNSISEITLIIHSEYWKVIAVTKRSRHVLEVAALGGTVGVPMQTHWTEENLIIICCRSGNTGLLENRCSQMQRPKVKDLIISDNAAFADVIRPA